MRAPDEADSVRWHDIPGPKYYDPSSVVPALLAISAVADLRGLNEVSNRCLFALGNNHGGWLYPAAIWAAPFLVWYVVNGTGWTRFAALDILTDALCFDADSEYPEVEIGGGVRVTIQEGLRASVAAEVDALLEMVADKGEFDEVRALALGVLISLDTAPARIRASLQGVELGEDRPRLGEHGGRRTFDQDIAEWRAENPD